MSEPLCRCGREKQQHERRPANWYSTLPILCQAYKPMDFTPFEQELAGADGTGCHCDPCNALKYAANKHVGRDWVPFSNALYDALLGGTHVYRNWSEWAEKLKADATH
ncbi:hypothetical protein [Streptomyces mirabilis]|uniref:hypothetical protein n=1 Tax=Streptomyces mirabilis TaxID=68239 RepID=UPI00340819AC